METVQPVCLEQCSIKVAIDILSKKWTMVIIRDLVFGQRRYSELEKSLLGISPKTLSTRLKELEGMKIITRREENKTMYYQLTEVGEHLEKIIRDLETFGEYYKSQQ